MLRALQGSLHLQKPFFIADLSIHFNSTRFYGCNNVRMFCMKRPFHKGKKDKENEFAVSLVWCTWGNCVCLAVL